MRVVVTGGSGKGGRWVVRDLREHGHDVLNVDLANDGGGNNRTIQADLTDLGQALELFAGADAVVHFAAIPASGIVAAAETVMTRPSAELMAEVFPDVPLRRPVEGRETLLSIERARRLLGYEPAHRWSDHVTE